MALLHRVVFVAVVGVATCFGGGPAAPLASPFTIQRHLFGDPLLIPRADSTLFRFQEAGIPPAKKSVGLAAIYSLLLPGMGELYAGNFSTGKYFSIAEGALWLTFTTFQVYGDALRSDARTYAVVHAGVNPSGKDDQFFVDVGNFLNTEAYNDKKLRDREPEKLYDPALGYAWQWESDAARQTFRDQRISSENVYNSRKFVVAAIIVNHVASAINAARAAISFNKSQQAGFGDLIFSADVMGDPVNPHGIKLTVSKIF